MRSGVQVLSLAKLRVGQEAYQLSGVAQSLDDYYTGAGEAAGRWMGAGAERLGLAGEVAPDDLRAVLAGLAPGSGGLTPNGETNRPHPRRVPGFDLTFKTPKSVAVLYAVTDDPRVQAAIVDAGEVAVREALGWLEREAIHVRRGTGNEAFLNDLAARDPDAAAAARIRTLPGRGVVAAAFRHRTSRSGDPLLHWHTLVANLVEGPDGRWSAFVHPDLYRSARAAGEVFQAVLRAELTRRLGIEWRPGRHVPEVAGVPDGLCQVFSKRSREIDAWLAATGTPDDPAGRQAAVFATRRHKPEVEHERFDAAWKREAAEFGWGPDQAEALLAIGLPAPATPEGADPRPVVDGVDEAWVAALCRDLTEADASFTRADLVQAAARRLGAGAAIDDLERVVARVFASPHVLPIGDGARWSSAELVGVERRFLTTARSVAATRTPIPDRFVAHVLAERPELGADQADAVRTLTTTTDGVAVMVGPAGTGKTFTLDAARAVFEAAGCQVRGVAPSARAAHELQADAHIPSSTIHRLLGSWARGHELPDPRTIVVVDEAAMAGVRDLDRLTSTVIAAGGRVVLVGDHHQLPEVSAGGGFAALAADPTVTVSELTVNRRQLHAWERDALAELRDGHVAAAVAAYRDHGRVVASPDRAAMLAEATDRWFSAEAAGRAPVLIAGTNDTVDALNHTVRQRLQADGQLGEHLGTWAGRDVAVGDRVVLRRNDYTGTTTTGERRSLLNGHTAVVTGAAPGGITVRLDDGDHVALGADYLQAGGVDHGYALTAHRAQGGTWDLAIHVGAEGLYREAGYLVLSRGRNENWLLLTAPELADLDADLDRHDSPIPLLGEEPDDLDTELHRRLNTSRAKRLALTDDPHADAVAHAAATLELAELEARAAHARAVERRATAIVGIDPDRIVAYVRRAEHTAHHIAVGQSVKPADRNNIGTVTAVDDRTGTAEVRFVATDGRTAQRRFAWADIEIVDPRHPPARGLSPEAERALAAAIDPQRAVLDRWYRVLAAHDLAPREGHVYDRAAGLAADRAAARLAAVQPGWLTELLGRRPTTPAAAQVWDDAVHLVAAHRTRHLIDDPHEALGPTPPDPALVPQWQATAEALAQARVWLDTHSTAPALPATRVRATAEIERRLLELDAIFATAPADHRQLINELQAGQLSLDDPAVLLDDALAAQGDRRRWILEHWPHVVEHHQLQATLAEGSHGPDPDQLLEHLARTVPPHLATAAEHREPWLVRLASQVTPSDADQPTPGGARLLADVAAHRQRWSITSPEPLGLAASCPEEATERTQLATRLAETYARTRTAPHLAADPAPGLDDLGW